MGAKEEAAVPGGDAEASETKTPHEVEVVQSVALLALQIYGVDEALLYQVLHMRLCALAAPHVLRCERACKRQPTQVKKSKVVLGCATYASMWAPH